MKKISSILFATLFLLAYSKICAQDIKLQYGDQLKTISKGSFIQIELPKPDSASCRQCPINTITGQLISNDSAGLIIQVVESNQYLLSQSKHVGYEFKTYSDGKGPVLTIPKKEILSLIVKGKNKFHHIHPGDVVGEAMIRLSISALLITSLADHRSESVLEACSIAILSGGIVKIIFNQPFYKLNLQSGLRKSSKKVWDLN